MTGSAELPRQPSQPVLVADWDLQRASRGYAYHIPHRPAAGRALGLLLAVAAAAALGWRAGR